ncbi:MAG: hypothetical protein JWN25_830 [Verrucomicrobiales bacterium]|nr:hypothetical protein [Verrucomicrobiales bacterium]
MISYKVENSSNRAESVNRHFYEGYRFQLVVDFNTNAGD